MKVGILLLLLIVSSFKLNAQSLNAFFLIHHTAGCDNTSGKVSINAVGGNGNYTYLWSNGSTIDTAYNLGAGSHFVTVYSGLDSVTKTIELDSFGVENVQVNNACNGDFGSVFLDHITATYPIQIEWYSGQTLMIETTPFINALNPGNYQYILTDSEGCIDTGSVAIAASSPQLNVFLADSSLCWYGTTQVWYTPGFTLIDSWGNEYNSTVDTFTVINNMASSGIPEYAIDSFGCSTNSVFPLPFVYLQSHPNPCQIYRFGDTLSLNFVPNLQPDLSNTYTWSCNGQQLEVSHNSYFVFDSAGFYSVSIQNSYGCIVAGTIQVSELELNNNENSKILAYPNPVISGNYWNIELTSFSEKINEYELFDSYGKSLQSGFFEKQKLELFTPTETGIYYLKVNGYTLRLMSVHE